MKGSLERLDRILVAIKITKATVFQELGRCFGLFPLEFVDGAALRRIFGLSLDLKSVLFSFGHELTALFLEMPN
jgi:hypothetical protein